MSRFANKMSLVLAFLMLMTCSMVLGHRAQPTTKPAAAAKPPTKEPAAKDPAAKDPKAAADADEPLISRMRVQDYPAKHFAYMSTETTLTQISETVQDLMPKLQQAMKDAGAAPTGPGTFVYQGITQDPNKPFTLEIGFPVAEGTKEAGDMKVRTLEAFHCASVIYSGPISQVTQAYQQAFTDLFTAGLQPTGETREMYLYWEAIDSPNNIELIMVGVH
jgi:effector-binding domain-containing protein